MKKIYFGFALAMAFLAASAGAQAGLQEGINAYRFGDFALALKELRPLADKGNADAQRFLGDMYSDGNGVKQSHKEAASWYRKAALQGNAAGQYALGVMCEKGIGVKPNNKEAASWYHKAAELGNVEAQYSLGVMYQKGRGAVRKDIVQAHKWFSLAVANGFEIAEESVEETQSKMTPEQIEKSQAMVREWQSKQKHK